MSQKNLCALTCVVLARGTTYYVSSSGSDGTSSGSHLVPFASLSFAGSQISDGDTLLLKYGDMWLNEILMIPNATNVTVGAYGNETLPRPLIQHGRSLLNEAPCATFITAGRLAVSDLHLSGCSGGMYVTSQHGVAAANVEIQRNFFQDIRTPFLRYRPPNPAWANALAFFGNFSNLTVKNCVGVRVDVFFESQVSTFFEQ